MMDWGEGVMQRSTLAQPIYFDQTTGKIINQADRIEFRVE